MGRLRYLENARTGTAGTICKGTNKLQFFDDDSYIYAASAGVLHMVAGSELVLTATTITLNGSFALSGTDKIALGTSSVPLTLTAGSPVLSAYTTCASTSGSTSVEPVLFYTTLTGAGGVGGRVRAFMTTNVVLGGWSNAFKAEVTYGASGSTTGLGSALLAEMTLSAGTSSGTYAPLEIELNLGTGAVTGAATSLVYLSVNGAAASTFDTNGFLFTLAGLTSGSGKALYNNTLKAKVGTTTWYLPLSDAEGSYTTAYPIVNSNITGDRATPTFVGNLARTNYALAIGTRAAALTATIGAGNDQDIDPMQLNLLVAGVNPGNSSTLNASYMLITHSTAMANMRLKCSDWNVAVSANIKDAYVYQGKIDITANTAIGSEACVLGLTMNVSAGTVTGLVRGVVIAMYGASMPASTSAGLNINTGSGATLTHGIILATQGGTTMTNAIYIEQGGTVTNILKFDATSAAVVSKSNSAGAQSYTVQCAVGGVTGYLRMYAD